MRFNIYTLNNNKFQNYINKIKSLSQDFIFDQNNFDYLFVFGGDKTFLKALKMFYHKKILIINVNEGRVGFLSSVHWKDISLKLIKNHSLYETFSYLSFNDSLIAFNEIIIETKHIEKMDLIINDVLFKEILASKIILINNLGSTAFARSIRYPIILRNNYQYLLDIIGEPMYYYYKPLNQPILLSKKEVTNFKFKNKNDFKIKYDNVEENLTSNHINIKLKFSKARILNINNLEVFANKVRKLF